MNENLLDSGNKRKLEGCLDFFTIYNVNLDRIKIQTGMKNHNG